MPRTPQRRLHAIAKEQGWTRELLSALTIFTLETFKRKRLLIGKKLKAEHDGYRQAASCLSHDHRLRTDILNQITRLNHKIMGQKPPDLTWPQWRTWNLAPFFRGPKKWIACADFFQCLTTTVAQPDQLRVEYTRLKRRYGVLPLAIELVPHLERFRSHRRSSRIHTITLNSAWPRFQLALTRRQIPKLQIPKLREPSLKKSQATPNRFFWRDRSISFSPLPERPSFALLSFCANNSPLQLFTAFC